MKLKNQAHAAIGVATLLPLILLTSETRRKEDHGVGTFSQELSSLRGGSLLPDPGDVAAPGPGRPALAAWLDWRWQAVEGLFNRVYGSARNPLYQSGVLAVTFIAVTLVTGLYLFLFYTIADPYGSVAAIDRGLIGGFMRSVHRYAADMTIVAVAVHALKMLLSGRNWGPRAVAWVSGVLLVGTLLICGWTGLVMAWDVQGQLVATSGAQLFDLLPIFSEPISRSFARAGGVPDTFFFMNLFLHVALPLGLVGLFWLHVTRVARPRLRPPKAIELSALAMLAAGAILVPVPLPPKADLLAVPAGVPLDVFYAFWLPVARHVSPAVHLGLWLTAFALATSVPWWWRPKRRSAPSYVDEARCGGCTTCYQDCPFDAISMVTRSVPSRLSERVARVDPDLCVACGICSGSCAPMGVGPPGRTGRDQLREAESFLDSHAPGPDDVVLAACCNGLAAHPALLAVTADGSRGTVVPFETGCSGSVHTSVIELLLRRGAAGVFLLTCPARDCRYREGPRWLFERVYNDREAELRDRVDKRRVRIASFSPTELDAARHALAAFRQEVASLGEKPVERDVRIELECEVPDELVI
jgi:coenzyme F420-reducing hydrogenase delta subunit/NAD-dependent dihydropyrimidine dehydrogenase PreA subunit